MLGGVTYPLTGVTYPLTNTLPRSCDIANVSLSTSSVPLDPFLAVAAHSLLQKHIMSVRPRLRMDRHDVFPLLIVCCHGQTRIQG